MANNYKSLGQMLKAGDYEALKNNLEGRSEKGLKELEQLTPQGLKEIDALLFFSAKYPSERQLDIMSLLIQFGANPNVSDKDQITILMQASQANNVEAVKSLLQQPDIDIHKKDAGALYNAGHYAVLANAVDAFELLVGAGMDPNQQCEMNGKTFLHYAAANGHKEMVNALIAHKVDPTIEEYVENALAVEMVPENPEFEPIFEQIEAYRESFKEKNDAFDFKSAF